MLRLHKIPGILIITNSQQASASSAHKYEPVTGSECTVHNFSCVSILYVYTQGVFFQTSVFISTKNIELRGFDALTLPLTLPVTLLTLHISFQWTSFHSCIQNGVKLH